MKNRNSRITLLFIGIICLALFIRVYVSIFTYVIAKDGTVYLAITKNFLNIDFKKALSYVFHPFYPLLTAFFSLFLKNIEIAARTVSILSGTAVIIPMYLLIKKILNEKIALLACFFVALHPYIVRVSADVISDSLYLFLFISSIYFSFVALQKNSKNRFFLSGILIGLAYLTRPEGIGTILITGFWAIIGLKRGINIPFKKRLLNILIIGLGFIIFAGPYLIYLRIDTGNWILTKKKSVTHLIGVDVEKDSQQKDNNYLSHLQSSSLCFYSKSITEKTFALLNKFIRTFHPLLLAIALFGLYSAKKISWPDRSYYFICSIYILYSLVISLLYINYSYTSYRHLLSLFMIGNFWSALGAQDIIDRIKRKKIPENRLIVIFCIIVAAILLPKTLKPLRKGKLPLKQAGIWIKNHDTSTPRIMSKDPRISFYADGIHVPFSSSINECEEIISQAIKQKATYMVLPFDLLKNACKNYKGYLNNIVQYIKKVSYKPYKRELYIFKITYIYHPKCKIIKDSNKVVPHFSKKQWKKDVKKLISYIPPDAKIETSLSILKKFKKELNAKIYKKESTVPSDVNFLLLDIAIDHSKYRIDFHEIYKLVMSNQWYIKAKTDYIYLLARTKKTNSPLKIKSILARLYSPNREHTRIGKRIDNGKKLIAKKGKAGLLLFGHYMKLPPARYRVLLWISTDAKKGTICWIDITKNKGRKKLAQCKIRAEDFLPSTTNIIELTFQTPLPFKEVETRIYSTGISRIVFWGGKMELLLPPYND